MDHKGIKSLRSRRRSYRVLVEHLGIPDLVDIIQDYAAQCEGYQLSYSFPNGTRSVYYDEARGILFTATGKSDDVYSFQGYSLLGQPVGAFPSGDIHLIDFRYHMLISNGHLIWLSSGKESDMCVVHELTATMEVKTRIFPSRFTELVGVTSGGLWMGLNHKVLSFYPWDALDSMVPLYTYHGLYHPYSIILMDNETVIMPRGKGLFDRISFPQGTQETLKIVDDDSGELYWMMDGTRLQQFSNPKGVDSLGVVPGKYRSLDTGKKWSLFFLDKFRGFIILRGYKKIRIIY
jgi:hypothetical protein